MEDLKSKYNKVTLERKDILDKIKVLKENENVKKYFSLCKQNEELANKQKDLYKEIKINEYCSCNHLLVTVLHDYDSSEGRSYDYNGCVKCGLNERVLYLMDFFNNPNDLDSDERIMYDFLKNRSCICGVNANILCDLKLAKDIYKKIKEDYPDIDDETAAKYLKAAIYDIRSNKASNKGKTGRTRSLTKDNN